MKVEWVFVQDLYQSNSVFDTEHDVRITVPVVRVVEILEWVNKQHIKNFPVSAKERLRNALKVQP